MSDPVEHESLSNATALETRGIRRRISSGRVIRPCTVPG